jgi:hypothetical protein
VRDFPHSGAVAERLRFLLGYAVLAPSGHNSQPWRFRLDGDVVELHEDRSRALPLADPSNRELAISCGAALEHLVTAMRRFSMEPLVDLEPEGSASTCLARVRPGADPEPGEEHVRLLQAMTARRSNRLPFEDRGVPGRLLADLQDAARRFDANLILIPFGPEREEVANLVEEATRIQFADPAFRRELSRWLAPNGSGRPDGMPGYAHGLGGFASRLAPFLTRRFDMGTGQSRRERVKILTAPALVVLCTAGDGRGDALRAGRALALVLLQARAAGLWASFFNAAVQLPLMRRRLSRLVEDEVPQLLFRLGYAPAVAPTPRRGVAEVVERPPGGS